MGHTPPDFYGPLDTPPVAWLRVLKWCGTALQIAGASVMAFRLALPAEAYVVMLVGSVAWLIAGVRMREWSIVLLYVAFTALNIGGLIQWNHR